MFQRISDYQEWKRAFGVGADVMGKYEESNFTTVVGNRDTFRHENERKMEIAIRTLI